MHQPAKPSNEESVVTSPKSDIGRQSDASEVPVRSGPRTSDHKLIRQIIALVVVAGTVLITFYVWEIVERHPRTDDAAARANVVGIAPRGGGQILNLNVQDNQLVKKGDVLFEIDPEDYKLALEKAKAELAALDRQIAQAQSTLQRLPTLPPQKLSPPQ